MGECWKYYAKWKKPETKGHRLYDFMYVNYTEKASTEIEGRQVMSKDWGEMEWAVISNG